MRGTGYSHGARKKEYQNYHRRFGNFSKDEMSQDTMQFARQQERRTYTPSLAQVPATIQITNGGERFSQTPDSRNLHSISNSITTQSFARGDTWKGKKSGEKVSATSNWHMEESSTNSEISDSESESSQTITLSYQETNSKSQLGASWLKQVVTRLQQSESQGNRVSLLVQALKAGKISIETYMNNEYACPDCFPFAMESPDCKTKHGSWY